MMRCLNTRSVVLVALASAPYVVAISSSLSLLSPSTDPPNTYKDVILPQIYAALTQIQSHISEPAVKQSFNASSFYLPPSLGIETLEFTQNRTAIRVPPSFWRSALELDNYPTPEAIKFSFEEFPLNGKTAAFYDLSTHLIDAVAARFDPSPKVAASMNAILNTEMIWSLGIGSSIHPGVCQCLPGGDQCSPRQQALGVKFGDNATAQDVWKAMFDSVVDVLSDDTIVRRLEQMELPNRWTDRDRELMRIAGLPLSASSSVLGAMKKIQYSLYQELTMMHHDCPGPVVECGKYSSDPCDRYPPGKPSV